MTRPARAMRAHLSAYKLKNRTQYLSTKKTLIYNLTVSADEGCNPRWFHADYPCRDVRSCDAWNMGRMVLAHLPAFYLSPHSPPIHPTIAHSADHPARHTAPSHHGTLKMKPNSSVNPPTNPQNPSGAPRILISGLSFIRYSSPQRSL